MVYLGGPRRRRGILTKGIYLHDPPPGYRAPRLRMPLKDRQRLARRERILLEVLTAVLILTVIASLAMVGLIIANFA